MKKRTIVSLGSGIRRGRSARRWTMSLMAALAGLGLASAPSAELLNPPLGFPLLAFDNMGTTAYDADSDLMLVSTRPLSIRLAADMPPVTVDPTDTLSELVNIAVQVDESGALVGGVAGDDLAVTGQVDLDGDGLEDFAGLLLTGEVVAFGFSDSGGSTDSFDFLFEVSGGLLATLFAGGDVAVVVTSEFSDFAGDFSVSFGGEAKGTLGRTEILGSLGDFVWEDLNGDGIQDLDEPGIAGVKIQLSADTDGDGVDDLLREVETDADGGYLFESLPLGVELELSIAEDNFGPGGPLEGLSPSPEAAIDDPALDSSTSPVVVLLTGDVPQDLTIDFGFTERCDLELAATCEVVGDDHDRWDCRGQVKRLVFEYTAEGCTGTTNDQWGYASCEGGADGASPVDIVVRDADGEVIADFGDVMTGERIEIADNDVEHHAAADGFGWWDWVDHDDGVGSRIEISVDGSLEVVSINTSCRKPLNTGDAFGSFRLVEITSTKGGTVTEPEPGEGPSTCLIDGAPPPPHCVGRIESIGLRYLGGSCDETTNHQGGFVRCAGDAADTDPVRIVVTDGRGSKSGFGDDVEAQPHTDDEYQDAEDEVEKCERKIAKAKRKTKKASSEKAIAKAEKLKKKWKKRHARAVARRDAVVTRMSAWASNHKAGWVPPGHRPDKPGNGNSFRVLFDSEEANVSIGQVIEVVAEDDKWSKGKLPPQMIVEIYQQGGDLIQKVLVHTSCSEPLDLGDRFGSVEVVSLDTTERRPISLGEEVRISYAIANPNGFEVFDVVVEDDLLGLVPGSPIESIAAGEADMLMGTAFVTESIDNLGIARAADGMGGVCGPAEATTRLVVVPSELPWHDDHDDDDDDYDDDDYDDDDDDHEDEYDDD